MVNSKQCTFSGRACPPWSRWAGWHGIACVAMLLQVFFAALVIPTQAAVGSFRAAGTEFHARRNVSLTADRLPPVVVTEFLHHGEILPDGRNVAVVTGSYERSDDDFAYSETVDDSAIIVEATYRF